MKPVTTITQKESVGSITTSDVMQSEIQQLSHISNGKQWKWRTRFLIGLVVLVIILAAVIVGAVFLGKQLSKDSIQTFQATYKTDSRGDARENIIVSATEVKFQMPGVADAVLDFDKGLSMYKRLDEERSSCFLTTFNASEGMAPKELKEYLEKTQGTYKAEREIHYCYKATNVSISNRNFLSPITKDMCNNVEIVWMINYDIVVIGTDESYDGIISKRILHYLDMPLIVAVMIVQTYNLEDRKEVLFLYHSFGD